MIRILLLFLTFTFAGELEVDGDLKVTGNIDAQNNPIKNVGIPQTLTDAINGNVLQDALRDQGPFEYKYYRVFLLTNGVSDAMYYLEMGSGYNNIMSDWIEHLGNLVLDDWTLVEHFNMGSTSSQYFDPPIGDYAYWFMVILKKPIEE